MKGVGKIKAMARVGAKAGIPKTGMYKGSEVMNEAKGAVGGGKAYAGAEVQKTQPVKAVKPRKKMSIPKTPSHTMSGSTGSEAMYG